MEQNFNSYDYTTQSPRKKKGKLGTVIGLVLAVMIVGIGAGFGGVHLGSKSIGIIGGADGPTQIITSDGTTETNKDENDGSVEVSVSVIGAESSVEVIDGKCTFVTPGSYTVKYSATDADGHTVEKEYAIEVILGTKKGDLDGDGEITVADALVALRIAARMAQATEQDMLIGDIDLDGEITVSDALAILRVAARMTDEL